MALLEADTIKDIRLAYGSVAPVPLRVARTETSLRGRVLNAATISDARATWLAELQPIDDVRSTAEYRVQVAANLLEEFLHNLSHKNMEA